MSTLFTCNKEIYNFLLIVKNNQMLSRKDSIEKEIKKLKNNSNPKLDDIYHEAKRIYTQNGYVDFLTSTHWGYELTYQSLKNNEEDLILSIYKDLNLLKADLIDLGFTGNINEIFFNC